MRRLWIIPIAFVALLVPVVVLAGGAGGFDGVVRSIETRYHVQATHIPFMGLISAIARKATHEGVANVHVAEFEDLKETVDGDELKRLVEERLGAGWERIIRETSRRGCEQTLIFMHPEGDRMGLFVVTLDGHEMDVVQVSVDPDHLSANIDRYKHGHHRDDTRGDESD